jgi:nucleotide-binding universal stress UspA family protein
VYSARDHHRRRIWKRPRAGGPVVLATLGSHVTHEAERLAIATALEADRSLVVVDAAAPCAGRGEHVLRATAERAAALGIRVERLIVGGPRAIARVANQYGAGLLVLGPYVRGWRSRLAARVVRRDAACLVWIAADWR